MGERGSVCLKTPPPPVLTGKWAIPPTAVNTAGEKVRCSSSHWYRHRYREQFKNWAALGSDFVKFACNGRSAGCCLRLPLTEQQAEFLCCNEGF